MVDISESVTPGTLRTIVLQNDSVRVTLLPERGGEIHQIIDRATGLSYLQVGESEIERFSRDAQSGKAGLPQDYTFWGFLTMFPNAAVPAQVDGRSYPLHGDIRHVDWSCRIARDESGSPVYLTARSRTVPAVLNRRVLLDESSGVVSVTDELVYAGDDNERPFPYIYGLHPYHGYPLIDEGTVLTLGADEKVTLPPRTERVRELYDAADPNGLVEIYNPRLNAGIRMTTNQTSSPTSGCGST